MIPQTIRTSWTAILLAALLVFLLAALLLSGPAAAATDNKGFIYGRVVTEKGAEYKGFLRWGNQEAFWDDLFHSAKEELEWVDYVDEDDLDDIVRSRKRRWRLFDKYDISIDERFDMSRVFITRFGDVALIEARGDGDARVHMKGGGKYDVSGYADDVSSKIYVKDENLGDIGVHWNRIDTIEFMTAPRGADPGVERLYGTVMTDEGEFKGYIQWDKQECLSTDELDGDTDDGRVSLEMGRIRSIESRGRRSSDVVLKDGREMNLDGTNDVNNENRGVMVEDDRFGRVTIGWRAFEKVTFSDPPGSGRGYDEYKALGPLQGTVSDDTGDTYKGRIVYDLDESEGWEMLNADIGHIEFDIPFYRIVSIEPAGDEGALVTLTNGEKLRLEGGHDVTEDNAGILIFIGGDNDKVKYLRWTDVEKIQFDHK